MVVKTDKAARKAMRFAALLLNTLLLAILLMGCTTDASPNREAAESSMDIVDAKEIDYREGDYHYDVSNMEPAYTADCVPDMETAVSVAQIYLTEFQKSGNFPDYLPRSVFYDTDEAIWIVSCYEDADHPGACLSLAIRKTDGAVIKMWLGE